MRRLFILFALLLHSAAASAGGSAIPWQTWSERIFERAARENRLVLLDLEAVWCHWCHVMDEQTYSHPEIAELIERRYLAVKVDQDSRPDLANRYRDYGWPATVVFDAQGRELAKRAGFLAAPEMAELLRRLDQDPRPLVEPTYPSRLAAAPSLAGLSEDLAVELRRRHREAFDPEEGGLRLSQKFLDADSLEYSLHLAAAGDGEEEGRARKTLRAAAALVDPVWGGVYQYSHGGNWANPHFEKILSFQRDNLKIYSRAYRLWKDPEHRKAAAAIRSYLKNFLRSPEGAFYASQDADLVPGRHASDYFALDDGERRLRGMPRIDRHRYARENGWAAEALIEYYLATGELEALEEARRALDWVLAHRRLDSGAYASLTWASRLKGPAAGGFRHDAEDEGGPFLGDTLAVGTAALKLYAATAERRWLETARGSADFILRNFSAKDGGYFTARGDGILEPARTLEENTGTARFLNLLGHYTGNSEYFGGARRALAWLALPQVATARLTEPGILLAAQELAAPPLHLTVVGSKRDPQAGALFAEASRQPEAYLRVEWWDRSEGPLPNSDVGYPALERSAAFVCSAKLCSSPVFQPQGLGPLIQKLQPRAKGAPHRGAPRAEAQWKLLLFRLSAAD
ncbi:MAG TPA: DUF255 domain-containing protein [bacterium]|nr:DUF255 domain-containing protein [bacterium]